MLRVAKIAVIGAGYVGLSTSACMSSLGHQVICADIDEEKIRELQSGVVSIVEDRLEELVILGIHNHLLSFVVGASNAVTDADFVFLCLPTPQSQTGEADLSYVIRAASEISNFLKRDSIVINKSTVPVGSTRVVENTMRRADVSVVSNPEFLREGTAVSDFLNPDRIVIGCDNQEAALKVADLYERIDAPMLVTNAASAEMIKYAANGFLATKLSFINEVASLCSVFGADINDVTLGMGYDKRIGREFLRPGPGWGGSCFPKDSAALVHIASTANLHFRVMEGAIAANQEQLRHVTRLIVDGSTGVQRVAVWGLTFKALTDDLRESPSLAIISQLIESGHQVSAFDPTVDPGRTIKESITIFDDPIQATEGADVLAVLTEWEDFRWVDPNAVARSMRGNRVVDARNLLDKSQWKKNGFIYVGIGQQ
jgi:UDPglucose 6-dehydrogenase